jgi:hypothetical protein
MLHWQDFASGLYYKPMTTVNDDSRVANKLEASLTDNARVVDYNHHILIVQATGDPKVSILKFDKLKKSTGFACQRGFNTDATLARICQWPVL